MVSRSLGSGGQKAELKIRAGDFPCGLVVKDSPPSAWGAGSIPGQGARITHASQPKKQKNPHKNKTNIASNQ